MIMLQWKLTRFPNNRLVLGDSESRFLLINGRCRPFCFLYWCFRLYARTSKQKHATQRRNATIYTSKVWISVKTTWNKKTIQSNGQCTRVKQRSRRRFAESLKEIPKGSIAGGGKFGSFLPLRCKKPNPLVSTVPKTYRHLQFSWDSLQIHRRHEMNQSLMKVTRLVDGCVNKGNWTIRALDRGGVG